MPGKDIAAAEGKMTFKRMISACVPSYFVDRVRARRFAYELAEQQRKDKEEAERCRAEREASSWADAVSRAANYDEKNLTEFRLARSQGFQPDGSLLQTNILGLVAAIVGRGDLAITDLGGSTGELGREYLLRYPASKYVVVDIPCLVDQCRGGAGLSFTSHIPSTCDIFYSSGTLQYLEHPMAALEEGMVSASQFVILRRNHLSDKVIFDIQRPMLWENGNGPIPEGFPNVPVSYPRQTLIEADIFAMAKQLGLFCLLKTDDMVFARHP